MNALLVICVYNLLILVGTAYLVEYREWSPWWFLLSMCCLFTLKECKK